MERALNFKRITRRPLNDNQGRRADAKAARNGGTALLQIQADRDPLVRYLVERGGQRRPSVG